MNEQTIVSGGKSCRRKVAGSAWRAGIAKDQLIFIIICSAAIAVAAVTLVVYLTSGEQMRTVKWQCISCNHEFASKSAETPPIECQQCGGQAVRLTYRTCPECKKEVLVSRARLTEQGQAKRDASRDQSDGKIPGMGETLPMEIQFWLKQADDTYKWSEWVPTNSPHLLQQYGTRLQCSECGAGLSSRDKRKQR